ncbi:MAG: DEAD/DEAH box helicase [Ignavibacteriae bacterium]|nr:DEAD/DEAH box helicase [Ignavibacteriota bacterium]
MIKEDIKLLTTLNKDILFKEVFRKLTLDEDLSFKEKTYILACAILILKHYQKDNRYTSFADLSYYIILKYSLNFKDYLPLYDFSTNFGFYPITKAILNNDLSESNIISNCFIDIKLEGFKNYNDYFETQEQYLQSKRFLSDITKEKSYIAPTSFGKSSLMIEYIRGLEEKLKIVIVVPTKSLLMQTYKMIREADIRRKIIIHDEMYTNENTVVAIFTQERSLRLLRRNDLYFDVMIIDEAHNMLKENDGRNILLSRLIAKNRLRNPQQKIVYLSPLIENVANLKIFGEQEIASHVVNFNIKEPEIFEHRLNEEVFKYNRFVNEFYKIRNGIDKYTYLKDNSGNKNFIYNYRPIKIEQLAKELCEQLPEVDITDNVLEIVNILKKEVHKDFYGIKYLKYGLVYLHGKLPDLIKEYLEYKYKTLPELKFVIANSVILEGMNLPIDTLFIFNVRSLYGKELMNLIGRVNRLNNIFDNKAVDLRKLLPRIHFINNKEHYRVDSNMKNKITLLRSRNFEDIVENPILDAFNIDKLNIAKDKKEEYISKTEYIKENEIFLNSVYESDEDKTKQYLIESGIIDYYYNVEEFLNEFLKRLNAVRNNELVDWDDMSMMDRIEFLFVFGTNLVSDFEIKRLNNEKARNYYEYFILNNQKKSLNENISSQFRYFKDKADSEDSKFYFGIAYGEETYESGSYSNSSNRVYVDLSTKNDEELVNLAIVKLKMEEDFISFKLNKFIVMMFDYNIIGKSEYNLYIYGTTDEYKISLTKYGLSLSLISRLERDGQLNNIDFDEYNNLRGNSEFDVFVNSIDDFYKFEISRYLKVSSN